MRSRLLGLCLLLGTMPTWSHASPDIELTPADTLKFGNVQVSAVSGVATATIRNIGASILTLSGLSLAGPHAAMFSLTNTPTFPQNLPPGGTTTFGVRFSPTSVGLKNASVAIASSAPGSPTLYALSGTGVGPVISTSATLAFVPINVGAISDQLLSIGNIGIGTLSISSLSFSGVDAASFSLFAPPTLPIQLIPGASAPVMIRCSPTHSGPLSATLAITSNDPSTPIKSVSLTGTGIGPAIATSSALLAFGELHVDASADLPLQISNAAGGTLSITGFSFTGADAASFAMASLPTLPINLTSGAAVTVQIRCSPMRTGSLSASLGIASNDAATPTKSVALTAISIRTEPDIAGVRDIPNDQGGRVKLSWDASALDTKVPPSVDHYWIFRSVPPQAAAAQPVHAITSGAVDQRRFYTSRYRAVTYYWELLHTVQAIHFLEGYSYIAATLSDSTGTSNPYTLFMVMALDAGNTQHWDSAPDSGYSVDNLAPTAPMSLTGSYFNGATRLHWRQNVEPDLGEYRIYRGSSLSFVPGSSNLVGSAPDTGFADTGAPGGFYKVSAVDRHGNESVFAALTPAGTLDVPGVVSMKLALARPVPNPVRGEAEFSFTLPEVGPASLWIFDGQGRRVATVVDGPRPAGRQAVRWNGSDDGGQSVPAGVYFARLTTSWGRADVRFSLVR